MLILNRFSHVALYPVAFWFLCGVFLACGNTETIKESPYLISRAKTLCNHISRSYSYTYSLIIDIINIQIYPIC